MEKNLWITEDNRAEMANRLRRIAQQLLDGQLTPDDYSLDAEWIDKAPLADGTREKKPSGRVTLTLSFWTTPIDKLQPNPLI